MNNLTPDTILKYAMNFIRQDHRKSKAHRAVFHDHFGSSPEVIACIWNDLALRRQERTMKNLKQFLMAHYFIWLYPKNRGVIASTFNICEDYCGGQHIWDWIEKTRDLKAKKIIWREYLDDPSTETFIATVDGTDLKRWEPKTHPRYNIDKAQCSHKMKHAAGKFEIGISAFRSEVVWVSGPHRGGKGDREIFQEGMMLKVKPGKMVIADSGYENQSCPIMSAMMALPSQYDPPELHNFKARARCRHESFNGRMAKFNCVSTTFRHGTKKMELCIEAVIVTLQYQMENGSPLFDV